jgi:hypothetical protein
MKPKLSLLSGALLLALPKGLLAWPFLEPSFGDESDPVQVSQELPVAALLPPSPSCVPVPTGAVAWLRAQSNTVDTIGVNDALALTDRFASLSYMTGKVGAAFRFLAQPAFPSITNGFFIPGSTDLDVGAAAGLTMECWLKPGVITNFQPIVEWNDGHGNVGAGLGLSGSSLSISLGDTNVSPSRRIVLTSASGLFTTSSWHHVALTFDKAAGLATVYVDGQTIGQTNLGNFRPATRSRIYLGVRPSGTNAGSYLVGGMDELTIYNRALSAAEIQTIVSADSAGKCVPPPPVPVRPPAGIVGWWRGELNTRDSVDSNIGVITNGVFYGTGEVGRAFEFDSGYVRIPAASSLDVGKGPGFTLEAWVFPEPLTGLALIPFHEFIGWHSGSITQGVNLSFGRTLSSPLPPSSVSATFWQANLVDAQGVSHLIRAPADLAVIGMWQHVALTYDKASGIAAIYFNGNPVLQTNVGSFTPQTAANLNLGFLATSPIFQRTPYAELDEVSLYSRALSFDEIRAIMLARSAGKTTLPPSILNDPASLRVNAGNVAMFSVMADGNPILKYRWRKEGIALAGETGSSLVLTNVQLDNAGLYSVRITNAFGAVVSSNALLTVNQPPVADASATQPLFTAAPDCTVSVILDGSRSSDPDGDALHYFWYKTGETNSFATGAVAVVKLSPGVYPMVLSVDDGLATNTQSFTVEVQTTLQAVRTLISTVITRVARPQPLLASLYAAENALGRSAIIPAANELKAFENKVSAQVAPADAMLAQSLVTSAGRIASLIEGGCDSPQPTFRMSQFARQANGKIRMRIAASPGFVYIIEASTNLVDWEKIGVARDGGTDSIEFDDAMASEMPVRFYRLVAP